MKKQILVIILLAVLVASCFTFVGCEKASKGLLYELSDDGTYCVVGLGTCRDTNIVIPEKYKGKPVASIGENVFGDRIIIEDLEHPSLTDIIEFSIESITIPNSVTSIGHRAFYHCTNLKSITIPSSVMNIGDSAFALCDNLTNVTFAEGCKLTSISEGMFSGCTRLTQITIPSSVTTIGESAFENCEGMTSVIISNGVTSIGDRAFQWCDGLTMVTIPTSVTSIGVFAFDSCDSLTSVVFDAPQGWSRYIFSHATSGTSLTLTDPTQNAKYLRDTYSLYYWYKN